MNTRPNAVELSADAVWFVAESLGVAPLPWVLAIVPPYSDPADRHAFADRQSRELERLGVLDGGVVDPAVADWVRAVCECEQWLELRYVGPARGHAPQMMRGLIARDGTQTVVVLRNAQLVTLTSMTIDHPHALVPVLGAGLSGRAPARFAEFSLAAQVGARADERIRNGADPREVIDDLGIPASARAMVESVFSGDRTYAEVVAGQHRDGQHATTQVGVGIVDTPHGRVLVSPSKASDGQWISTFAPGTPFAIAVAVDRLTHELPNGSWFPEAALTRDFRTA